MHKLLFAVFVPVAVWSQPVTFGAKGGIPFGRPTQDYGRLGIGSNHWIIGPVVEFRLPLKLGLEVGGLYSRYTTNYPVTSPLQPPGVSFWARAETGAWDFPAVLKYRFTEGSVRPYLLGGVNYRRENSGFTGFCQDTAGACSAGSYDSSQDRLGPALGGGVEWKFGYFRIAPEFRYIHLNRPGANQYNLLLGITF